MPALTHEWPSSSDHVLRLQGNIEATGLFTPTKKIGNLSRGLDSQRSRGFRKVTVNCPKAPFSQDLISSMAKQAGVTKKFIYELYFNREPSQAHSEPTESKPLGADAGKTQR